MPSKYTVPDVVGVIPAIASSRVVLPAPLGPMIATSSPAATVNDAESRRVSSPRLRTWTRTDSSLTSMRTPWIGFPTVGLTVVGRGSSTVRPCT